MTDRQINKWLRRQFSVIGWVLMGYYGILNVLAMAAMGYEAVNQMIWSIAAGDFSGNLNMDAIAGNAWGYIAAVAVGLVILHGWKGSDYWRQEIFVKEKPISCGTLLCLICFCMGAQMVNSFWFSGLEWTMNLFDRSLMPLLESVAGQSDSLSMFLYASILAPISEEILFRGYILRSLRPFGKRFAIFGSALLFGLFHGNLLQTPYALIVGLVLGYVTVEYSIWWAIFIHGFNNLVLADLLTRLTMNLPDMALSILNLVLFGGGLLISAGILLAKRQDIRAYRRSEWMDRRVLKWFFLNSGILLLSLIMAGNMIFTLFL